MYSVMWSEHCSYKSSKVHLRQFGEKMTDEMRAHLMVGIGENAGVVDIGDGYAVTFKVESHNHPSLRRALPGRGHRRRRHRPRHPGHGRPARRRDGRAALRSRSTPPTPHRVLPGIVAGVGGYGNCLGLPNIGGEAVFDATYAGNPLVNALCVGVLRHEDIHLAKASGAGNQVILYGARTGGDGIGGVSVLASRDLRGRRSHEAPGGPGRRPVHGEAADRVHPRDLRRGPRRRHPGPRRRRPLLRHVRAGQRRRRRHARLARPGAAARLLAGSRGDPDERVAGTDDGRRRAGERRRGSSRSARKWDVDATVVGEVNDSGRLTIDWHGERVVDVPPAHRGARRPVVRPALRSVPTSRTPCRPTSPRPSTGRQTGDELRETLLRLVAAPTSATSPGSPTSTTATCRATPCSRSRRTPA